MVRLASRSRLILAGASDRPVDDSLQFASSRHQISPALHTFFDPAGCRWPCPEDRDEVDVTQGMAIATVTAKSLARGKTRAFARRASKRVQRPRMGLGRYTVHLLRESPAEQDNVGSERPYHCLVLHAGARRDSRGGSPATAPLVAPRMGGASSCNRRGAGPRLPSRL